MPLLKCISSWPSPVLDRYCLPFHFQVVCFGQGRFTYRLAKYRFNLNIYEYVHYYWRTPAAFLHGSKPGHTNIPSYWLTQRSKHEGKHVFSILCCGYFPPTASRWEAKQTVTCPTLHRPLCSQGLIGWRAGSGVFVAGSDRPVTPTLMGMVGNGDTWVIPGSDGSGRQVIPG